MPQRVQMPDGSIAEFPDSMTPEQISAAIRSHKAAQPTPIQLSDSPLSTEQLMSAQGLAADFVQRFDTNQLLRDGLEAPQEVLNPIERPNALPGLGQRDPQVMQGFLNTYLNGLTFNLADDVAGIFGGPDARENFNADIQHLTEAAGPGAAMVSGLAGGLPWMAAGGALAAAPASMAGKIGAGLGVGLATGGAYGYGGGEGGPFDRSRIEGALESAALPGLVGAVLPPVAGVFGALGRTVGNAIGRRSSKSVLGGAGQTAQEQRAISQGLFDEADRYGIAVTRQSYDDAVQDMALNAERATGGIDPDMFPVLGKAVDVLARRGTGQLTLRNLQTNRSWLSETVNSAKTPTERAHLLQMRQEMDAYLDNLTPADLAAGTNPDEAAAILAQARTEWAKFRRIETIDDLAYNASLNLDFDTQAGRIRALQNQFRAFLKSDDVRFFNAAEIEAMEAFVQGGKAANSLRRLGGSMPRVMGSIGAFIGEPSLIAGAAAGEAARRMSAWLTNNRLVALDTLVRTGSKPVNPGTNGWLLPAAEGANVYGSQKYPQPNLIGQGGVFGALPALEFNPVR